MFNSVCIFSSAGRLFQSSVPWTENVDCANYFYLWYCTILIRCTSCSDPLTIYICFGINWYIISGAILFTQIKNILIRDKCIEVNSSKLYFCKILQWRHLFGFLSKMFSICLYRDRTGLIVSWETWLQTVSVSKCEKTISCMYNFAAFRDIYGLIN